MLEDTDGGDDLPVHLRVMSPLKRYLDNATADTAWPAVISIVEVAFVGIPDSAYSPLYRSNRHRIARKDISRISVDQPGAIWPRPRSLISLSLVTAQ